MEDKLFEKYTVKCPNCGHEFLPWRCLSVANAETEWRTHCCCPNCATSFDRDDNYVNKS